MSRLRNLALTITIVTVMMGISSLLGYLMFGPLGVMGAVAAGLIMLVLSPNLSPRIMLRLTRAVRLTRFHSPQLYALLDELAGRAGLSVHPALYVIPQPTLNAMTVGSASQPAILLTQGLVSGLASRELAGVLAHEVSHIRKNDPLILGLAASFRRFTHTLTLFGLFYLLFALPLLMAGAISIPAGFVLFLVLAPTLSLLLQLALSRTREFEADRTTVELTADTAGFVSALRRIEHDNRGIARYVLGVPAPARPHRLLATHPPTEERIRRLTALEDRRRRRERIGREPLVMH